MKIAASYTDIVEARIKTISQKNADLLEAMIRAEYKKDIKEDQGGLVNSIVQVPLGRVRGFFEKRILVDKPYAQYVENGRGPIYPVNAKVLSNRNTSEVFGHSPFIAKYAGPFEGYHSMQHAVEKFIELKK